MAYTLQKPMAKGMRRQLLKRMPSSNLDTKTIMQRVVTVLIKNVAETYRDAPMKTLDLMKEIGLKGWQIKEKEVINKALYLLMAQKVVYKLKQNPIRWELHEEYKAKGLPRISYDRRAPWRKVNNIQLESWKVPRYGPIHGRRLPEDEKALAEYFKNEA